MIMSVANFLTQWVICYSKVFNRKYRKKGNSFTSFEQKRSDYGTPELFFMF